MEKGNLPPRPNDEATSGFTWVYDHNEGRWKEVPIQVIMPGDISDDGRPDQWPIPANPVEPSKN